MNRSFLRPGISFVLAAVLLLSATACAAHEPILPPSRWGEMQIRSMFERYYSISDAFQETDAVVQANQNQEAVIYRQSDLEELFKSLS